MSAFLNEFPNVVIKGCYFHLTQSVMCKSQDPSIKADYESEDLGEEINCLPVLVMIPTSDVLEAFLILLVMPNHENIPISEADIEQGR